MRWSVRCTCSHLWINMGDRFASLSKHTARTHTHTANAARQSIASFIQFGANDDHLPPFNTHFSTYSDTQAHTTYIANWECENAYTQSTKKMVLSNRNGGDMRFSAFSRHAFHIDFSRWSALLFICICMCVSVWVVWLCMYEGAKWQTAAEAYRPDAPGTMHRAWMKLLRPLFAPRCLPRYYVWTRYVRVSRTRWLTTPHTYTKRRMSARDSGEKTHTMLFVYVI